MNDLESLTALKHAGGSEPIRKRFEAWHDPSKPALGWICTYVPEELIYAAGAAPVRVMGDGASGKSATAYLYVTTCSFALACLELGLEGEYDFLQGLITVNACDPVRRLFDVWQLYMKTPFTHLLSLPRKLSANSQEFFYQEVVKFKRALEDFLGREISEASLKSAIQLYNRSRTLLRRLYELRGETRPRVSSSECLEILRASMVMPRERFNDSLDRFLQEAFQRDPHPPAKARLLLCGSLLDSLTFVRTIEELGGTVVADELCTGSRYFWDLVEEGADPLASLAKRYLTHSPCARMRPIEHRFDHIAHLVREYQVDGAISQSLKFCDIYGHSKPRLREELGRWGIPVLEIDLEYDLSGLGQIRTRIQSFIEMLERKRA